MHVTEIQVLHWDLVYHQYFLILQSPSPGRGFASPNTDFPYLTRYYKDLQPIINQEYLKDIIEDDALNITYWQKHTNKKIGKHLFYFKKI